MDFKQIQELLKFLNKSDLTEVVIEEGDFKLRVERKPPENVIYSAMPATMAAPVAHVHQPIAQAPVHEAAPAKESSSESAQEVNAANLYTFKSPMIGTFYRSPGPEKDSFVKVGDSVSNGSVLCIIEAMKLFNEIECDVDGKIVKILVDNAQPVEYDQPLFLIER